MKLSIDWSKEAALFFKSAKLEFPDIIEFIIDLDCDVKSSPASLIEFKADAMTLEVVLNSFEKAAVTVVSEEGGPKF